MVSISSIYLPLSMNAPVLADSVHIQLLGVFSTAVGISAFSPMWNRICRGRLFNFCHGAGGLSEASSWKINLMQNCA